MGVGTYVHNLINELIKLDENIHSIDHEPNGFKNEILIKNYFKMLPFNHFFWNWQLNYQFNIKKPELDIIHSPESCTIYKKLKNHKTIITVHDIRQVLFPEISTGINKYGYKLFFKKALTNSDKIITVSENTKLDIICKYNVPKNKISVIPLAASHDFQKLNDVKSNHFKIKYSIDYPFILYVGSLDKHKNIPNLLKAYYKSKKMGIIHKLVITGKKNLKHTEIFETIEKLSLQNDVIFTGYIPDEDLPLFYNKADLFVYPSIYEGFGIPPLEAMACGTPVITSNTSSLPEVVGDAGIMVNPYDVDELANKMYEVLNNEYLRKEMSKKGLERAQLFSWKKCAAEHLKVYEEVYNMK